MNIENNSHKQATKKFSKKIRVGLTLCLFIKCDPILENQPYRGKPRN